jgi:chorismate dehydratase|tara:strand:- start:66896 stop:67351 length:456 start_codon:yes stop_codon:yes gene_type:complete
MDPKTIEMGPDISSMLESCDGALLIGDRALSAASRNPETVQLDLGADWTRITGLPMVFGVFATRKDSPMDIVLRARNDMLAQCLKFNQDEEWRNEVILATSMNSGLSKSRISDYFSREVENILDTEAIKGLELFLHEACGMEAEVEWVRLD